jgi:hypothetical protein
VDWSSVEQEIGTALPPDYKAFVETYGGGTIDHFLSVLTPIGPTKWANLVWRAHATEDPMDLASPRAMHAPFEPYPAPGGLLAFAQTDNGDVLYWKTVGGPENWTVVVFPPRAPEYLEFDGSMTEFLEALFTGRVSSEIFPRDFPCERPTFESYYAPWSPSCDEYFANYAAGRFDERAQLWFILPVAKSSIERALAAFVVGSAGGDGIQFCFRAGERGVWAYYPQEKRWLLLAKDLVNLERGWLTGAIKV